MKRVLLLCGIIVLAGCARNTTEVSTQVSQLPIQDIQLVSPSGSVLIVHAEIASTPAEQEQGLMQRDHLAPDAGMLFRFAEPQRLTFWMKNTLIPLDILFFDTEGNFVSSATMTPCTAEPCTTYSSQGEALSALEMAAGFTERHGIGGGWRIHK